MPDQTRNLNSVTDFAGTLDSNDRIIMTDNKASLKALTTAILGKAMIEGYTGSSLAGSSQSVKSAIDALNSNMLSFPSPENLRLRYRTDIDCNSVTDEWVLGNGTNFPPGARFWYIHSFAYTLNSNGTINIGKQMAYGYSVDKVIYERTCSSGVWNEWTQLPTRAEIDALNSNTTPQIKTVSCTAGENINVRALTCVKMGKLVELNFYFDATAEVINNAHLVDITDGLPKPIGSYAISIARAVNGSFTLVSLERAHNDCLQSWATTPVGTHYYAKLLYITDEE